MKTRISSLVSKRGCVHTPGQVREKIYGEICAEYQSLSVHAPPQIFTAYFAVISLGLSLVLLVM
jgi:hypothetical protein